MQNEKRTDLDLTAEAKHMLFVSEMCVFLYVLGAANVKQK